MLTTKQFADLHNRTPGRIVQLCQDGKLPGAVKLGRDWLIPEDATMPEDKRIGAKHRIKPR